MPFLVLLLKIAQEPPSIAHHFQKAPARVVVFLVLAEMPGNLLNFRGQNRYLHLWGPGVAFVSLKLLDNRIFFLRYKHKKSLTDKASKCKTSPFLLHLDSHGRRARSAVAVCRQHHYGVKSRNCPDMSCGIRITRAQTLSHSH